MSKFNTIRTGLLGSAAVVSMLAAAPAQAVEAQFGDVSITFDTTVSMGASMRVAKRNTDFLAESNGGRVDPRLAGVLVDVDGGGAYSTLTGFVGSGNASTVAGLSPVSTFFVTNNPNNFDGSVNSDDARLNFDHGDLTSGNVKATHDLVAKWRNYTLFARGVGFYDVVMNDEDVGARSKLTDDALGDVGRNYELLDLFVSADFMLADDVALNLRVGKQAINWGESTFIQNGINAFSPVDVSALRRPGSEIREALLPVNAIYGSVALPFNLSISGYYALDWEPVEVDASGTPFSSADFVAFGTGVGGNEGAISFTSGSPFTGMRRNCRDNNPFVAGSQQNNAVLAGILPSRTGLVGDGVFQCTDDDALTGIFADTIRHDVKYAKGRYEEVKAGLPSILAADGMTRAMQGIIERVQDVRPDEQGDFGISAKFLAEDLGGTEFGFYYQNYTSRLPFVNIVRSGAPDVGFSTAGDGVSLSGVSTAGLTQAGCGLAPGMTDTVAALTIMGASAAVPNTKVVNDPMNLINPVTVNAAVNAATAGAVPGFLTTNGSTFDHARNAFRLNCMAAYYQSVNLGGSLVSPGGMEGIGLNPHYGLRLEYPEDIKSFGFSFNTVLDGVGLQAEMTYRPEAPFQVDGDTLTIWNATADCVVRTLAGGVEPLLLAGRINADGSGTAPVCGSTALPNPIIRNEMFTAQFGTTSTLTGSSTIMSLLGSDGGVLLTEFGMVYVPGVEETWNDLFPLGVKTRPQYAALSCQGSDLGLGSILGLDARPSKKCRPNDFSAGMVMVARWDYNNAFDSGFLVQPTIAYSWDFAGSSPAPYSNYLEDRQSINLGLTGTLNNNLRIGANYTNFFGGHIQNKQRDQDFASINASYSF